MSMYSLPLETQHALDEAIAKANKDWTAHARPIALAVMAMDAPAGLYEALTGVHWGKSWEDAVKTQGYREAIKLFDDTRTELLAMLDGIRDNYRCDHYRSYPMDLSTISEAEADEIEAFNEALDKGIVSVDAFMDEVERTA